MNLHNKNVINLTLCWSQTAECLDLREAHTSCLSVKASAERENEREWILRNSLEPELYLQSKYERVLKYITDEFLQASQYELTIQGWSFVL